MKHPLRLLLLTLSLYPTLIPAQTQTQTPTQTPSRDSMYTFTDPNLAFRVMVPLKNVTKSPLQKSSDDRVISQLYYCTDSKENVDYVFGVNSIPPSRFVENDSIYYADLRKFLRKTIFSQLSLDTSFRQAGYIVIELSGKLKTNNKPSYYRLLARGNRWYVVFASYPMPGGTEKVRAFFRSFTPLDLPTRPWQKSRTPDSSMSTWTPYPLISSPFDSATRSIVELHDISYDSIRANTYTIIRSRLNPYYWTLSDSAFLQERIAVGMNEYDSLIYKKLVSNGNAKGWEWMKRPRNSMMYQRIRVLLNGDQPYTLYASALKDDLLSPDADRFFADFRFTRPIEKTHLFDPKETALLDALFGADPKAAASALAYVTKAPFREKDLPLLEECMLKRPASSGRLDPIRVNLAISNCIAALKDSSAFRFAALHYNSIPGSDYFIKGNLLMIMSCFPSQAHYSEMAALVQASLPTWLPFNFFEMLKENLHQTARIMPQLLSLSADSLFRPYVISLAGTLADSNLLTASALIPYEPYILRYAAIRDSALSSDIGSPLTYDVSEISLLGLLNSPGSNAALEEYVQTEFADLRVKAFAALLRNGRQKTEDLDSLAADKSTRLDVYRVLQKAGRVSLFPPAFLTQQLFSESAVYSRVMEFELEPPTAIDFLTTKLIDTNTGIRRFFFYKVRKQDYDLLACAGPYGQDLRQVDLLKAGSGAIYDYQHLFDPAHAEDQMSRLMEKLK